MTIDKMDSARGQFRRVRSLNIGPLVVAWVSASLRVADLAVPQGMRVIVEDFGRSVRYPYCVTCGTPEGRWPCTTLLELADGFAPGWRDGG